MEIPDDRSSHKDSLQKKSISFRISFKSDVSIINPPENSNQAKDSNPSPNEAFTETFDYYRLEIALSEGNQLTFGNLSFSDASLSFCRKLTSRYEVFITSEAHFRKMTSRGSIWQCMESLSGLSSAVR